MQRIRWYLVILAALFPAASLCVAAPVSPDTVELQTGWQLSSSWNVVQDGSCHLAVFLRCRAMVPHHPHAGDGSGSTSRRRDLSESLLRQEYDRHAPLKISSVRIGGTAPHLPRRRGTKLQWLVFKGINYRAGNLAQWRTRCQQPRNSSVCTTNSNCNVTGKVRVRRGKCARGQGHAGAGIRRH